jgi:hypothetical protein
MRDHGLAVRLNDDRLNTITTETFYLSPITIL